MAFKSFWFGHGVAFGIRDLGDDRLAVCGFWGLVVFFFFSLLVCGFRFGALFIPGRCSLCSMQASRSELAGQGN